MQESDGRERGGQKISIFQVFVHNCKFQKYTELILSSRETFVDHSEGLKKNPWGMSWVLT